MNRRHWLVFGLCALVAAGLFVWRFVPGWQQKRALISAQAALVQGNLRGALLAARHVHERNPFNSEAIEILISIYKKVGTPDVLVWRRKLLLLDPRNDDNRYALISEALRFQENYIAFEALVTMPKGRDKTARYYRTAGAVAVALDWREAAKRYFDEALKLEPESADLKQSLLCIQLASGNPAEARLAREAMQALQKAGAATAVVLRALIADAHRLRQPEAAMAYASELCGLPGATFGDQIIRLEETKLNKPEAFPEVLEAVKLRPVVEAGDAYTFLIWLNTQGMAAEGVAWAQQQQQELIMQPVVQLALADCYLTLKDWEALRAMLNDAQWGSLEFMRFAVMAKITLDKSQEMRGGDFKTRWDLATIATRGDFHAISMLAQLAEKWGLKDEASDLWWTLARRSSAQRIALRKLENIYQEKKSTKNLLRVAIRLLEVEPGNMLARNNVAYYSLLLNQDLPTAFRLARESHEKQPKNPVLASTYAWALHRQGRNNEAIELLQIVPPELLRQPAYSACYGPILAAIGRKDEALTVLKNVAASDSLLPEEKEVVRKALESL